MKIGRSLLIQISTAEYPAKLCARHRKSAADLPYRPHVVLAALAHAGCNEKFANA